MSFVDPDINAPSLDDRSEFPDFVTDGSCESKVCPLKRCWSDIAKDLSNKGLITNAEIATKKHGRITKKSSCTLCPYTKH